MPRGALPDPNSKRRNAPTIPTTFLPSSGREGPIPDPPSWCTLYEDGRAWWAWAWRTPEACGWGDGNATLDTVARRAMLVDVVAGLARVDDVDLKGLSKGRTDRAQQVLAATRVSEGAGMRALREMGQLDKQLGIGAEARARLRWTIVLEHASADAEPDETADGADAVAPAANESGTPSARERLKLLAGGQGG